MRTFKHDGNTYKGIPIGIEVRGTLGGKHSKIYTRKAGRIGDKEGPRISAEYIYRHRKKGILVDKKKDPISQEKYTYFVPSSIRNEASEPIRQLFKEAIALWQNVLTPEEKKQWNTRAKNKIYGSGYNLYIREYILQNK